ncbi:hypothetical protein N7451_008900 [Penicillium sp. IBT 35674x]|nr:hypothetical protein N7451_008900 [Penicillium sp. IBT 35674x]
MSAKTLAEARVNRRDDRTACTVSSFEDFQRLPELDQMIYFKQNFEALRSIPRINLMVLQNYHEGDRLDEDELEATDQLQEELKNKWSFVRPDRKGLARRRQGECVKWGDENLWWNPSTQEFEMEDAQKSDQRHLLEHFESTLREYGFLYHITSSLLIYRLILFMGSSQSIETDGYKSCWEVRFYHTDGCTFLRLWDNKGRPRVSFYGLKESQNDALEFLNLLTTYKFPHTFDGTIAGAVA